MTVAYNWYMEHDDGGKPLTISQIKSIVKEAVHEGIDEKLLSLGVDVKDPIQTQRMFQLLRDIMVFRYGIKAKLWGTVLVLSVTGVVTWVASLIWEAMSKRGG